MLGFLKALAKPSGVDRNPHLADAARNLETRNFVEAARHLGIAVEEADRQEAPAAQRLHLRIELAGAQRLGALALAPGEQRLRRLEEAFGTICSAVEIAARSSDTRSYVECLDMQATILADQEQWAAVESVQQDAIRLAAALPHPDAPAMAQRVRRLAAAHARNDHPTEALAALGRAIQMHEQAYGPGAEETAQVLVETARLLRTQRQNLKAQPYLKRALQIEEQLHGTDSQQAAQVVQQLASSYEESGNLSAAAQEYERALTMKLRKLGVGNLDEIAEMQYSLARLHAGWGNLTRARELLAECIGDFQRRGGPKYAAALETLAQVENTSGRFQCAAEELGNAVSAWEKCGPTHTADLVRTLDERAGLLERLNRPRDAGWLRDRIAELTGADKPAPAPAVRKLVRPAAGRP